MVQGGNFRRTNFKAPATKPKSSGGTSKVSAAKKGQRVILPKKAKIIQATHLRRQFTATLNRRAEASLILRSGNEANSLVMVRPDERITQELKDRRAKRDGCKFGDDKKATKEENGESASHTPPKTNAITQAAIDALNASSEETDQVDHLSE